MACTPLPVLALSIALALTTAACAPESSPEPGGVGPDGEHRIVEPANRAPLELERPALLAEPAPEPPAATVTEPPVLAPIGPDIADLGPFDVLTWAEAQARAAQQIQAENADAELHKLRVELENQP